jgi:limonene-1,2-epoxide hydrolase
VRADELIEVVRAYEEAYNRHDSKAVNQLYAPDARFHIEGIMAIEGKQALIGRTDYDIELHTHIHVNPVSTRDNRLQAHVTESNEWLREIGIGTAKYEAEFEVIDGKIKSIIAKPVPTTRDAIVRVLNDFSQWGLNNRPSEARILMPEGKIIFNAHNARLGLIILREWKAERE